jgi:predicted  nucleic acid-binding Zn-ribbon protein
LSSEIITTVAIVLGTLLALAGSVGTWAALRVGRNAQTLSNYRDAIQSWKERSETQEAEIAELRTQLHQVQAENADLRGQVNTLRDAISGRSILGTLEKTLARQHAELLERLDKLAGGR